MAPGDLVETYAKADPFFLTSIPCTGDGWENWVYVTVESGKRGIVVHRNEKIDTYFASVSDSFREQSNAHVLIDGKVYLFMFSLEQLRKIE